MQLGAIVFSVISIASAYTLLASDTSYTPKDTTWEVDNTKDALDDLYKKQARVILLWKNDSPNSIFYAQTLNLKLKEYDYVLIKK